MALNALTGQWSLALDIPDDPTLAGGMLTAQGVFYQLITGVRYSTTAVKVLVLGR